MVRLFISFLLALSLSACGLAYQKKTNDLLKVSKPEDWGILDKDQSLRNAREFVQKSIINSLLKDPNSAVFKFGEPRRGTDIIAGEAVLVWYADMQVNAKNSFGGYVGYRTYSFEYICNKSIPGKCKMINYAVPNSEYPGYLEWRN